MNLFDTSVHALRARVRCFEADLARWVERTSETGDLRHHHSQVARLHDFLGGTLAAVVRDKPIAPGARPPFGGTVDQLPGYRRDVGTVHLLWEFFRDKLAQRDMGAFTDHLGAADDLAWACYEPFLAAATAARSETVNAEQVKEPPLVFYSTDRTPFAQARTKTFHPMGLDSGDLETFADELQQLPVPVIGMPWEVANRMPETTLVGHEAGHVIAEDLEFAAEVREVVQGVSFARDEEGRRRSIWLAWSGEVFADVIGVLATGSAFVEGLVAELAGDRNTIRLAPIDVDSPGQYPTPMLRVALCEHVLGRIGVAAPTSWREAYGAVVGSSRDYVEDVDIVAAALLDRRWEAVGDTQLTAILPWDEHRERNAGKVAAKALAEQPPPVAFDVRTWVAASMHAYRAEPDLYASLHLDRELARRIVAERAAGARSSRALREPLAAGRPSPEAAGPDDALRRADREAGERLARRLGIAAPHEGGSDADEERT